MLEKILIKNYLLLRDIEIFFGSGFNILTGETGAGKSILINAMSLLLGERADYSIISKNKDKMIVEGWIKITEHNQRLIKKYFSDNSSFERNENNQDESGYLILRRELYTKGYSRNFINDSPVNINELKAIGDILIDIHSQNEHQSLLNKSVHIELLDSFTSQQSKKFESQIQNYSLDYTKLQLLDKNLSELKGKKEELENKRSFIEFQLKEINDVNPVAREDDELERELKFSENTESIQQALNIVRGNLYDDNGSIIERLKIIGKELDKLKELNQEITDILKEVTNSTVALQEANRQIENISNNLVFDPAKIENIRERLFKLQFIKKKYGNNIEGIIKLKQELERDLSVLENFDEEVSKLEKEIDDLKEKLYKIAAELSAERKEKANILESEIVDVLNDVGFENAGFKIEINNKTDTALNNFTIKKKSGYVRLSDSGIDDVEFLVKVNKGDEFSSLRKTASGGEISRIMLAIKTVLADADKIDVLIFDEIDTGISGRIAQKVGKVLKKLSGFHQIISITHLAQIAALAEDHFLVEKEEGGERTVTKIRKLVKNERVIEVAKLLSGEKVTDATIKSAKELIGELGL